MYKKEKRICKKVITSLLTTTMALGMFSSTGTLKVKADGEIPNDGYLTGITNNLGEVQNSWYIDYDSDLYDTLTTGDTYASNYIDAAHALEIKNAAELAAFAKAVTTGGRDFLNKYVKLKADIDLEGSGVTFAKSAESGNFAVSVSSSTPTNLWKAIGSSDHKFKGTFDGDAHTISNMIGIEVATSGEVACGLFGYTEGATIQDVKIGGTSKVFCASEGDAKSGSLVGDMNSGTITNCSSNCDVCSLSGSGTPSSGGLIALCKGTVTESCATGEVFVSGSSPYVCAGGLIAHCDDTVTGLSLSKCYATGNVFLYSSSSIDDNACGGALGFVAKGTVSQSYALGNVAALCSNSVVRCGGFFGWFQNVSVDRCFATGAVLGCVLDLDHGGRAGGFGGDLTSTGSELVTNCFATGDVKLIAAQVSLTRVTGFLGYLSHAARSDCYQNKDASVSFFSWNDNALTENDLSSYTWDSLEADDVSLGLSGFKGTTDAGPLAGLKTSSADTNTWVLLSGDFPQLRCFMEESTVVPTVSNVTYAEDLKLSGVSISNANGNTPGTWEWDAPNTSLTAGTDSYSATFVPEDKRSYFEKNESLSVTVDKADPVCIAPKGFIIFYGDEATLEDLTLVNSDGNTAGTWAWKNSSESLDFVGYRNFPANFTPTDTSNYNLVSEDFNIKVAVIAVPSGTTALLGQTLEEVAIKNPAGNIVGTWVWSDESTPVGAIGSKTFAASFVPANHNYDSSAETNVSVRVVNMSSGMLPINGSGNNSLKMNLSAAITENESTSYQWQRSDDKNASEELWENCTGTGNDTDTYVLEDSDYNYFVRLKVTYTPAGSSEQTLYSNPVKMMFKWGSLSWS